MNLNVRRAAAVARSSRRVRNSTLPSTMRQKRVHGISPRRRQGVHARLRGLCCLRPYVFDALGGWLAGLIYDWTGSYTAALVNGIA